MKKILSLILCLLTPLSVSAVDEWIFFDVIDSEPVFLSKTKAVLVIGEFSEPASICSESNKFCFSSKSYSFAVHKLIGEKKKWTFNGYMFCVRESYVTPEDSSFVIYFFDESEGCSGSRKGSAYYSKKYGLRFLQYTNELGFFNQLVSVESVGFGAMHE